MIYIFITLIILDLLILVHEYGHYLAASLLNIRVEEFALGMGPVLFRYKGKKTDFTIRLFPVGGFCSLQEEERTETVELLNGEFEEIKVKRPDINPEESFIKRPPWQKFLVLIAGVTMNFLLALFVIVIAYLLRGATLGQAITGSFRIFYNLCNLIYMSFKMLFTGEASVNELTGPIGIVNVVQQYYQEGIIFLLLLTAMLSINLGIINLLPIPALDGGQIFMLLIEKLKRGEIQTDIKEKLIIISYVVLIGLAIFIAYNDILRF